jgi:crossover junction endonuclease MUS81
MEFIVDNRETKAKQYFNEHEKASFQNLELGDFVFKYNGDIVCLIERKTISDLLSSIKDGRYKEQKIRLIQGGIDISKVIYLIEGAQLSLWDISDKTVLGCIISTLIRDNIKVFRTVNITETLHFLDRIYYRLLENPERLVSPKEDKIVHVEYAGTLKTKKKDNLTPQVCNIIQLSQIPNVSQGMALAILKEYGSIYNLCDAYSKVGDSNLKRKMVANIKYDVANGKQRRIGDVASNKVYEYLTLCPEESSNVEPS